MKDLMDSASLEASLDDLKVIYRVLTQHLDEHGELEHNAFYASLGRLLRQQAAAEGVDPDNRDAFAAWLKRTDVAFAPPQRDSGMFN
ncbi:MAG: hypothetical protein ACFCGT_27605 [Sandaracinaceae bacterium]